MPGVLNLFFLSAFTLLALACFLACVFTDPGRCGSLGTKLSTACIQTCLHTCSCKAIPCTYAAYRRIMCRVLMHCLPSSIGLCCMHACMHV